MEVVSGGQAEVSPKAPSGCVCNMRRRSSPNVLECSNLLYRGDTEFYYTDFTRNPKTLQIAKAYIIYIYLKAQLQRKSGWLSNSIS